MDTIHRQLENALQEHGFSGEISNNPTDLEQHATDESIFHVRPELVIFPRSVSDIQIAVQSVNQLHSPTLPLHLTPRAAGTGLSGGSLNDSVIINTTKYLNTIHGYTIQGDEVLFDIDPGVMYPVLEKEMEKYGTYIPSFPASKDICTVGGMVGNNAAGPDTFHYGHTAQYVESMNVVLSDGNEYTLSPLTWEIFETELKRDDLLGTIYRHVWELLLHQEEMVLDSRPDTAKNSAGYALWDVLSTTVEEFMKGRGVFDLSQVFSGSQGTLGVITRLTIRTVPKKTDSQLITIPIFDLETVGNVITQMVTKKPISIELFDGPTYQSALKNPDFFRDRIVSEEYKKTISYLPWIYKKRFGKKDPHFVLLVTLDSLSDEETATEVKTINKEHGTRAWHTKDPREKEMIWQVRRASYTLSKLADPTKRPAAFLEDMTVNPDQIGPFFNAIEDLFTKHDVHAYVHGHGGNGHLHFYPLMDFTDPKTADLIEPMADDFFAAAVKYGGNICGEHNDGIIRTPYLDRIFSQETLDMFVSLEHVCDPKDIFNPGKKVNPRFNIKKSIRHNN